MQLVELRNGSVLAIARNCAAANGHLMSCQMLDSEERTAVVPGGGKRFAVSISTNQGVSWSDPRMHQDLITPVCNAGITKYRDAILFTGPHSETNRTNLTVLASYNDADTFSRALQLVPGSAGYSSVQCGLPPPHDCGVLYSDQHSRIFFLRFSFAALSPH